ncbi:histone-lysine N-methyltransferase SETMAR [Trichonephila clavipes]|nr:histone-lysine N-methyltransferase SETMAR [Trichonephila clavipes]
MDVSEELVQGCLLYDFKVGLSASASSRRICQAFGYSPVNERTARNWFQKFSSGDLSLCAKARTVRPQVLDNEALQVAIEEDSSQACGELARKFNTSSEMVRLHQYRLGKTCRLSKWVPHTLLEVHQQQRVPACLSLLSRHCRASIFNRVLTSDEKWVLYNTPKRFKHWLSPQNTAPHSARPPMHPRKIMFCVWLQVARVARNTIQRLGWETLFHPPYSLDLAPSDYHLFHSLDNNHRGKSFTNEADVLQALRDFFASHTSEFYHKGIEQLETRWQKVLDAKGD